MNLLAENNAFHNLGLCLKKECSDTDQVDDFIQLCIQSIFYNKISLSGLVPNYVINQSSEIIELLNDKVGWNIDFQPFNFSSEEDSLIENISKSFCSEIDERLKEYKPNSDAEKLLTKQSSEARSLIGILTKAIKGDGDSVKLIKGVAREQSAFKADGAIVKIITHEDKVFEALVNYLKLEENKTINWDDNMTFNLLSHIRVITNQELAHISNIMYSPAVKRAVMEKQLISSRRLDKIDGIMSKAYRFLVGSKYVKIPSIKEYLITRGNGKPDEILEVTNELIGRFEPVRKYIQDREEDGTNSLQALNEIANKVYEELQTGIHSLPRMIIENIVYVSPSIPFGSVSIPITPTATYFKQEPDLRIKAFTEVINDMEYYSNKNHSYYQKELYKNCLKE